MSAGGAVTLLRNSALDSLQAQGFIFIDCRLRNQPDIIRNIDSVLLFMLSLLQEGKNKTKIN